MKAAILLRSVWLAALTGLPVPALAQSGVPASYRWLVVAVFGALIVFSLALTWRAARRVKGVRDFYTAGGAISGVANGWALAGDYLSAASFLGIAGLISLWGYDGFMYSVAWLVACVAMLLLVAEPCRNIGRYTLPDILAYRNAPGTARLVGALAVMTVSVIYLGAQMVGGGILVELLIGVDYEVAVGAVGVVMLVYVLFGGMVATTWVQVVKAGLLLAVSLVMVLLVWHQYGNFGDLLDAVVADPKVQTRVATLLGGASLSSAPGQRFLEPGLLFNAPVDQISLGLALIFGTIGMPHIMMRFFTVPNAQAARKSVVWAMAVMGGFYLLTLVLGLAAAVRVGAEDIIAVDAGGNMASPLLAQALGGGPDSLAGNFMMALVAAVAFVTIVAVVAGLVLAAASALAHDVYVGVIRGGKADAEEQIRAARVATIVVGTLAIGLGIAAKGQNVAHLAALAFAVAASANFPSVFLTLFWKRCNTRGIVAGTIVGIVSAIGLVLVSPTMTYPARVKTAQEAVIAAQDERLAGLHAELVGAADANAVTRLTAGIDEAEKVRRTAQEQIDQLGGATTSLVGLEQPLLELRNPGLISIPLAFLVVILGSLTGRERRAEQMWDELCVRRVTGIAADGPQPDG